MKTTIRYNLLTDGSSHPKLSKGAERYLGAILHLAPHKLSGFNVCKDAGKCIDPCLNTAGMGGIFTSIQTARIARTRMLFSNPNEFWCKLQVDLDKLVRVARAKRKRPVVRLNGTSDLPWELMRVPNYDCSILELYPAVQFYDYTKTPARCASSSVASKLANYHLTFSRDERNEAHAFRILLQGGNVATVFRVAYHAPSKRYDALPKYWRGFEVVDGDKTDYRFDDSPGTCIGLRAKGKARTDRSGFVVDVDYVPDYVLN